MTGVERVHLVFFSTQGGDADGGTDLTAAARAICEVASVHFSSVSVFTPKALASADASWIQTLAPIITSASPSTVSLKRNPAWMAIGGNLWKPRLLAQLASPDGPFDFGDIVVYHDVNAFKYPDYFSNVSDSALAHLSKLIQHKDVLLFRDNYDPMLLDVKKSLLDRYVPRGRWLRSHIWSGCIAFRVGFEAQKFMSSWYRISLTPGALDSDEMNPSRIYHWNSVDQATLTVLVNSNILNGSLRRRMRVHHLRGSRQLLGSRLHLGLRGMAICRGLLLRARSLPDLT